MTTTVLFVRHVPHALQNRVFVSRQDGVPLADDAPERLERLAARLSREPLAAVYASPVQRTRETAAAIAAPHGREVIARDAFVEIEYGAWSGREMEAMCSDPDWRVWNQVRSLARPPGGETMLEVQARMMAGLEQVRADHPDQTVAVVSHGDPIKTALLYLLGLPIDAYDRFEVEPGSISTVALGDWGAKLLRLNETVEA